MVVVFMGCTRIAGSDYPMDTKFMTVSLDPEEALKRGQEEFPEAFLTEDDFRIEESYCRKIVPEITYGSNPMVVYRTETLASDSRYVLLPHA